VFPEPQVKGVLNPHSAHWWRGGAVASARSAAHAGQAKLLIQIHHPSHILPACDDCGLA